MIESASGRGSLRTALLEQAETVLRERGIDALSLRELARDAGVSHGAPRSHFVDRRALLDALAERGFHRLDDELRAATARTSDYATTIRAAGAAYVDFAVREPALLELMFAAKVEGSSEAVHLGALKLFETMGELMQRGVAAGVFAADQVERMTLVASATVQGIAALVASQRIDAARGEVVLDDAISLILSGSIPA